MKITVGGTLKIGIRGYYRLFYVLYFANGYNTLSEITEIYNPYPGKLYCKNIEISQKNSMILITSQ